MPRRLNQIIAIEKDVRKRAEVAQNALNRAVQKTALITGISRTYQPRAEDGETLPGEQTRVQVSALAALRQFVTEYANALDVTVAKEATDQMANASVVVDGVTVLEDMPVAFLLHLERQLGELAYVVGNLPTLDPAHIWHFDEATATYVTEPVMTTRTKKVLRNHEKAPATERHPAQVEVYTEDIVVGDWTTRLFSGALPQRDKDALLARITKLTEAVKVAREEANLTEAVTPVVGAKVVGYVLG